MNTDKITIDIWSDIVCPFCYIGKKKIEQAIAKQNAQDKVEVIWHSFQLDPDLPMNEAIPSTPYLSERKGYPIDQVVAMCGQLTQQGHPYGIQFKFDSALTFNTFNAHRLIQWAKTTNKANALKEAFMVAYFTQGMDLSKNENLLAVVKSLEMDVTTAEQVLNSTEYTNEVQNDISQANSLGVRGVPYFVINGKQAIYGAQHDSVFENALAAALKEVTITPSADAEGICLPSGECK